MIKQNLAEYIEAKVKELITSDSFRADYHYDIGHKMGVCIGGDATGMNIYFGHVVWYGETLFGEDLHVARVKVDPYNRIIVDLSAGAEDWLASPLSM